jgi:putative transposase
MLYKSIGISKQGVHSMLNTIIRSSEEIEYLKPIIQQVRRDHPTMGCVAMYYKINPLTIGRDKFLRICASLGLKIERGFKYIKTTDSSGVIRFPNLFENTKLTNIDQAYCSDITYYEINGCFYYLTFIMDCFSRRILGHSVSSRLLTEHTSLQALRMLLKTRRHNIPEGVIFHSDGGGQYYAKEFLRITEKYGIRNSMCEFAYENGKAERLNGVIKNNYLAFRKIESLEKLVKEVDHAVYLYNYEKPHKGLNYFSPVDFEKKLLTLKQQTKSEMTESFDTNLQDLGASSPKNPEQTKSKNQDVFYTKKLNIKHQKRSSDFRN